MAERKLQLKHILRRCPETGGKCSQKLWVYEEEKKEIIQRWVTYAPGLYKMFEDILTAFCDPMMDALRVSINVKENLITVYNKGVSTSVEIDQEEQLYLPVKEFIIETTCGTCRRKLVLSNNLWEISELKCKTSENWTKVSFKPDLSKFNMTYLEEDVVALMNKRVIEMAWSLGKVKVQLNGKRVTENAFHKYVDLYRSLHERVRESGNGKWNICVGLSTEGQFQQVSFVNGIATINGGTHVEYVTDKIASYIAKKVNKKNNSANIKADNVKKYLWLFVNALIDNPTFDSSQTTLTLDEKSIPPTCEISDYFLQKVAKNCGIIDTLLQRATDKQRLDLKKTDGAKKKEIIEISELVDAYDAGGDDSDKCTLILTGGESAKALAMTGLSVAGRDRYGVYSLTGKLLNVREASHSEIKDNEEIIHFKQILGLKQDKTYESVENLRYGHLMILTDQDHDGPFIKGSVFHLIYSFWPSLLKVPKFMAEFITPIVKASHKNGKELSFFTMREFDKWKDSVGNASCWHIKYYKGLGTSTSEEWRQYFQDLDKHKTYFVWADEKDGESIELAFNRNESEARKNWLLDSVPGTSLDQKKNIRSYTDFVDKELKPVFWADLKRSIPSMVDGLKPVQRKILYCAFKENFVREELVDQFSHHVSHHSAYHHGEQGLLGSIIGMAQDFVGSNNVNLLVPSGQFGTRKMGGKDHAKPGHIYTRLSPITRFLFPREDDDLLDYKNEDGKSIEPEFYMPIIPTVLVNGTEGIATGWSSRIHNYNPRDIINNLRRHLNGERMKPMIPWSRGFTGFIEKIGVKEVWNTYTVNGVIVQVDETTLRITELPVHSWTEDYRVFLKSLSTGKDAFIKEFREYSDDINVCFEVILSEENMMVAKQKGLLKTFNLTSTFTTSNMHLFDPSGRIKKYDTPEQILEDFYHLRLELYEKRKKSLLDNLRTELLKLDNKITFIQEFIEGEGELRERAELLLELKQRNFTAFDGDYEYLMSMSMTKEKVQELLSPRDKLVADIDSLEKSTTKGLWIKDLEALELQLGEQYNIAKPKKAPEGRAAAVKAECARDSCTRRTEVCLRG